MNKKERFMEATKVAVEAFYSKNARFTIIVAYPNDKGNFGIDVISNMPVHDAHLMILEANRLTSEEGLFPKTIGEA